jgi:hypothetical protein
MDLPSLGPIDVLGKSYVDRHVPDDQYGLGIWSGVPIAPGVFMGPWMT